MRPLRLPLALLVSLAASAIAALPTPAAAARTEWKFAFRAEGEAPGYLVVRPDMLYTPERGYGFEPGASLRSVTFAGGDALHAGAITSERPFYFSVDVPEGNYRVVATLGERGAATRTTIKAELRRLMIEGRTTQPGELTTATFIVNVRTPEIAAVGDIAAGRVKLKAPRETEQEAWAWDRRLTLEFSDAHPALVALTISRVDVPTLFLLGDSTVCDQSREPYASWGQMLPRFFRPTVAVANHGESGESYSASLSRRRIDKIASLVRPGDVVVLQFGHNDQKERGQGKGPFLNYKADIAQHIALVRDRGGLPVIVTPMERRAFDPAGTVRPSLTDYAAAARQAAKEASVACIDLHALSILFYETLEAKATDASKCAFATGDNTHHNNYGAYQLAQAIAQGLREAQLPIAAQLAPDFRGFDPRRPDPVESFAVPASTSEAGPRPLGN